MVETEEMRIQIKRTNKHKQIKEMMKQWKMRSNTKQQIALTRVNWPHTHCSRLFISQINLSRCKECNTTNYSVLYYSRM